MNKLKLILLAISTMLLTSCKNDVDINGEWKDVTVVFGLLNQKDTAHYIRVSKAFLGEGDALAFADQFDSLYYHPEQLEVTVAEIVNGNQARLFTLVPDLSIPKEEGIFAAPTQILYKFSTPSGNPLNAGVNYRYRLNVKKIKTGETITAETGLVKQFFLSSPVTSPANLYPGQVTTIKWSTPVNGKLFEVFVRFLYREANPDSTDEVSKFVEINLGRIISERTDGGQELQITKQNREFYQAIKLAIPPATIDNPKIRFADSIVVILNVADDDLNTFLEVNKPSNTIAQERPQFSNIENGLGLFAARTVLRKSRPIGKISVDSLINNPLTQPINFQPKPN